MSPVLVLTVAIIAIALTFDFHRNGSHDAANSVATGFVSTRVRCRRGRR